MVFSGSGVDARKGYPLTGRREVRGAVVRGIVGELALAPTTGLDGVDLVVFPVVARIGYPLAAGTVGRLPIICTLSSESELTLSVSLDGVDHKIGSVFCCIGYLAGFARVVSGCRLSVKHHHQSHSCEQPRRCCQQRCSEVVEPNLLHYYSPF